MKARPLLTLLTASISFSASTSSKAEEVLVATASNFSGPMGALVEEFEARSGHSLQVSYGSSGRFFAQISNGAPFQLFLSADQDKPARLEAVGLVVPGSRFTYAVGSLVLWSATEHDPAHVPEQQTEHDPEPQPQQLAARLSQGDYSHLALANPRLAPYGHAAQEVLASLGLTAATRSKWVQGENIAQTYQFVSSGNADLGFVALSQVSQAMSDGKIVSGRVWRVPADLHSPIRQDAVLLLSGQDCKACREFMQYLQSAEAQQLIRSFGYEEPSAPRNRPDD